MPFGPDGIVFGAVRGGRVGVYARFMAIAIDTLAYARSLRECGFSEEQAEGQARALAAAMTDTLATKQDLRELETRMDARFAQVDARLDNLEKHVDTRLVELEKRVEVRFDELEKRMAIRFTEQDARLDGKLGDLERRMTIRLGGIVVATMGVLSAVVSALVKLI